MKKKISLLIDVILILIIIISITKFSYNYYLNRRDAKVLNTISEVVEKKIKKDDIEDNTKEEAIKEYFKNDDIKGRLKISSINLDTLLTMSNDNDYYMNHNIYKQKSYIGNPFIDYRVNLETGKIILIYGHNSKNIKVPFKSLTKYLDTSFTKNNPYISLEINSSIYTYEIFSVYPTTNDNLNHTILSFNDEISYQRHLEKLKSFSIYESNDALNDNDNILVLQTCIYNKELGDYLVIVAKRV